MNADQELLRNAYLAEMWPVCREVPRDVRAGWSAVAETRNERLDDERGAIVPVEKQAA